MKKQTNSSGWSYVVALLLTFGIIFTSIYMDQKNKVYANENLIEVKVKSGDTIWEISKQNEEEHNLEPSEFIKSVERLNDIDPEKLTVGQTIRLPITRKG